jgi:hypothetical protein
MFDAIDEATERLGDVRANGTPDQRRAMRYRKEVGPATKQRIRATLRSALSDALDQQLVTVNVAKFANLPSGKRPKALVWTKERDLVLSDAEVVRRRSGRRVCRDCAKIWHLEFTPPVRPDVCDTCGGALFQRYNDSAERVTAGLRSFRSAVAPVLDHYRSLGTLVPIDATKPPTEIVEAAIARSRDVES